MPSDNKVGHVKRDCRAPLFKASVVGFSFAVVAARRGAGLWSWLISPPSSRAR
jgi:hypothetical protein